MDSGNTPLVDTADYEDSTEINSQVRQNNTANNGGEHFIYGWLCLNCNALQILNKPVVFLICLCWAVFAQSLILNGITPAVVTSIQKQFGLSSKQTGLFLTTYNIACGVCSLFIGYLCTSHKPRYIGYGILIMVAGTVVICIPKFIADRYESNDGTYYEGFCSYNNTTLKVKDECRSSGWLYQLTFSIGYAIVGCGAQPLLILGPAHIDEITNRGQGSVYLGFLSAATAIGSAVGYLIAIPILQTWVEIKETHGWNPSHPNWVGAWWLGFLVGAALLLLPLLPILGFPREFPDTEDVRKKKLELEDTVRKNKDLKLPWLSIKALLRNMPYMFITLATVTESLAIGGFSLYLPKLLEAKFHFTASESSLYVGAVAVPGAITGALLGGCLIKKLKWSCEEILRKGSLVAFISVLLTPFILVGCDGGNTALPKTTVDNYCNTNCTCDLHYNPICTVGEHKVYYSPCYAGCLPENKLGNVFQNCSCFSLNSTYAETGRCTPVNCPLFPLFIIGIFIVLLFMFINNVAYMEVTLRAVNEDQGSAAMAFQQIFVRLLGCLPAPIIYGAVIDKACRQWRKKESEGESENCLEYDIASITYYMFSVAIAINFLSFVFTFLALKVYKPPDKGTDCTNQGTVCTNTGTECANTGSECANNGGEGGSK